MEGLFPLAIVVISSAGCYLVGSGLGRCTRQSLWASVGRVLECVGMGAIFFAVNLGVGMGLILAVRSLTPWFVSIYLANDVSLLALSLLQGFTLCVWWHGAERDDSSGKVLAPPRGRGTLPSRRMH